MHLILSLHRDWQYLQSLVIWLQSSEVMAIAGSTFSCHNNQSKCGLRFCYHFAKILKSSHSMVDSKVFQAAQQPQRSCRWEHWLTGSLSSGAHTIPCSQRPVATWLSQEAHMSFTDKHQRPHYLKPDLDWPKVQQQLRRWQNISRDLSHALSDLSIAEAVAIICVESLKKTI